MSDESVVFLNVTVEIFVLTTIEINERTTMPTVVDILN